MALWLVADAGMRLAPTQPSAYDMKAPTQLLVNRIAVGHLRRPVSEAQVNDLVDSISRLGLLQPLVVTTANELVAGRHRLEAVKRLGWNTVPVGRRVPVHPRPRDGSGRRAGIEVPLARAGRHRTLRRWV